MVSSGDRGISACDHSGDHVWAVDVFTRSQALSVMERFVESYHNAYTLRTPWATTIDQVTAPPKNILKSWT